jgi:hypothetical protein
MTAVAYTTDLTDITTAESTTGWSALGGGASGLATNADSSMQGTYGIGKQITGAEKGQVYGSGGTTIAAGRHVFIWIFLTTPGLAAAIASRGLTAVIGSSTTAYCQYHVEGNDTYGAAGRVAKAYPIDPSVYSSNTGSSPYRTVTGSPSGTFAQFGATANITGTIKGENLVVDAIRHGTGVFVTGGTGADPEGNFTDLAAQNDANAASPGYYRWGIFTKVGGAFELVGKLIIGQNNSGTATAAEFLDSNKTISVPQHPHVASTFNEILIDHASSIVTLTNVTIQNNSTTSPVYLTVTSNNPTVDLTNCNFLAFGGFIDRSNTTATGCAWRNNSVAVTHNGGSYVDCVFDSFTSTVTVSVTSGTLDDFDNCTFVSDGGNHAIDLGTISSTTSMGWNCKLTGYAATDGSTGNEAIKVNVAASQTLTINVASGADTPSIYNTGSGTVSVVSGTVAATLTVTNVSGTAIASAQVLVKAAAGGALPVNATVSISNSGTTATVTHTAHAMATGDKVLIRFASDTGKIAANEGVFAITKIDANSYSYTMGSSPGSSPTGTIYATYVLLSGTTNGSGQITMSRTFASNQPVTGWARKSSSAPYYKQGAVNGTVDTGAGASLSAILISDE